MGSDIIYKGNPLSKLHQLPLCGFGCIDAFLLSYVTFLPLHFPHIPLRGQLTLRNNIIGSPQAFGHFNEVSLGDTFATGGLQVHQISSQLLILKISKH